MRPLGKGSLNGGVIGIRSFRAGNVATAGSVSDRPTTACFILTHICISVPVPVPSPEHPCKAMMPMDCFDHERGGWQFGHGQRHGHGINYDIPWDGYVYLTRHVVPGSANRQPPKQ